MTNWKDLPVGSPERTAAMVAHIQRVSDDAGLDKRCPTCNAGRGKWCIGLVAPLTHEARKG